MSKKIIPNSDLKVAVTAHIDPNIESISISRKKRVIPNFIMTGNGTMNSSSIQSINLLVESMDSTKSEQYLLKAIINGINYHNGYSAVVMIVPKTSTHRQYLKEGYKSLFIRGLVKRVKRSHYMINPNALIPPNYESALEIWESLPNYGEVKI